MVIDVNETAAKLIAAMGKTGYQNDVRELALRLVRNVKLQSDGTFEDAHDADLLRASQWLAEYADVLDALDE